MRTRYALIAGACLCQAVAGCGSGSEQLDYPVLEGRFADEADFDSLIADEGFIGESEFFVRYAQGDRTYYGGGTWSDRIRILDVDDGETYDGPFIVPLQYRLDERWPAPTDDLHPVRILSVDQWHALRDRLFAEVVGDHVF